LVKIKFSPMLDIKPHPAHSLLTILNELSLLLNTWWSTWKPLSIWHKHALHQQADQSTACNIPVTLGSTIYEN
jgi:hypothetical protein